MLACGGYLPGKHGFYIIGYFKASRRILDGDQRCLDAADDLDEMVELRGKGGSTPLTSTNK